MPFAIAQLLGGHWFLAIMRALLFGLSLFQRIGFGSFVDIYFGMGLSILEMGFGGVVRERERESLWGWLK